MSDRRPWGVAMLIVTMLGGLFGLATFIAWKLLIWASDALALILLSGIL